jgi:hypothetical protein
MWRRQCDIIKELLRTLDVGLLGFKDVQRLKITKESLSSLSLIYLCLSLTHI